MPSRVPYGRTAKDARHVYTYFVYAYVRKKKKTIEPSVLVTHGRVVVRGVRAVRIITVVYVLYSGTFLGRIARVYADNG